MKLRWLIALLVLALAPVTAMFGWQIYQERRQNEQRTERALQHTAAEFANDVNLEIASSVNALTVLSQSEIFQQGRIAAMGRLLQGRPRRDWDSIFLLDAQGGLVLDTAPRPTSPAVLRELHAQALARQGPVVSAAALQPGIALAMPVMQDDEVRYVLGARLSESLWSRLAAQASPPSGGQARLYDAQGRLISQAVGTTPAGARLPAAALLAMNARDSGVHRSTEADGSQVIAAWDRVPLAGWHARVFVPAAPVDAAQRAALVHALSTTGAALIAGLAMACAAAVLLMRRARESTRRPHDPDATASSAAGAPHTHPQPDWRDEFVGMLAHELRNPLGAISAAADVLESTHPTSGSAADARAIIARQARQLSHTVHGLLEASRAMAGKISLARHPVELAALVRHVEETLAFTGELRQHELVTELESCWTEGDAVRLEEVVTLLVTQAARQAPQGTLIRIQLHAQPDLVLRVVSVSQRTQASDKGVEWTLARTLVQLHGGTLDAQATAGVLQFTMKLPARTRPQAHPPGVQRPAPVTPLARRDNE